MKLELKFLQSVGRELDPQIYSCTQNWQLKHYECSIEIIRTDENIPLFNLSY